MKERKIDINAADGKTADKQLTADDGRDREKAPEDTTRAVETSEDTTEVKESENAVREDKRLRSRIAQFFARRGLLLALLGALVLALVTLALAVVLGGDVYDKAAVLWSAAFLGEFVYCTRFRRRKFNVVLTVLFGVAAVAFTVLYALELKGIMP